MWCSPQDLLAKILQTNLENAKPQYGLAECFSLNYKEGFFLIALYDNCMNFELSGIADLFGNYFTFKVVWFNPIQVYLMF